MAHVNYDVALNFLVGKFPTRGIAAITKQLEKLAAAQNTARTVALGMAQASQRAAAATKLETATLRDLTRAQNAATAAQKRAVSARRSGMNTVAHGNRARAPAMHGPVQRPFVQRPGLDANAARLKNFMNQANALSPKRSALTLPALGPAAASRTYRERQSLPTADRTYIDPVQVGRMREIATHSRGGSPGGKTQIRRSGRGSGIGSLRNMFLLVAAGNILGRTLKAAFGTVVGFNSSLEQAKLSMAGLINLNSGGDFAYALSVSNKLIDQFRKDAIASTATMKELAMFAQDITGPIARAGGSMQDLRAITKGAVVASKALGVAPDVAALDVQQALMGTLTKRDRFMRQIVEPYLKGQGVKSDTTKAWNAIAMKNPTKALKMLNEALNAPALLELAKRQENSYAGLHSTIKDITEQLVAASGSSFFKALKDGMFDLKELMVGKAPLWLIEAKSFSEKMMDASTHLRSTLEVVASSPVGQALKLLYDAASMLASAVGKLWFVSSFTSDTLSSLTGTSKYRRGYQVMNQTWSQKNALGDFSRAAVLDNDVSRAKMQPLAKSAGLLTGSNNEIDMRAFADKFGLKQIDSILYRLVAGAKGPIQARRQFELSADLTMDERKYFTKIIDVLDAISGATKVSAQTAEDGAKTPNKKMTPNRLPMNVNISKIEVSSEDPDRFAFGLANAFEKIAQNPSQAYSALREA